MRQRAFFYAGLLAALIAIWLAYKPGLAGGFLFDDFANLPTLGETGPIDNSPALARYLTSGTADPTGRPVAVASFLIDAQNWPADPLPFKRTNLLIHLLNVSLLAFLLLTLGRRSGLIENQARNAALLGAAIWGLHPIMVSTTLYVVQREAMLPATFTLAALLAWLAGRDRITRGHIALGTALELTAIGLGTALATLSKANGILLPFYILLIEHLLLRPLDTQALHKTHRTISGLLWFAVVAVIAYLIYKASLLLGIGKVFGRDWSIEQRLMTEPRVMWDYLRLLWLPRPFTSGLFNDQFRASTSLLQPWTTLPALAGVFGLIAAAWFLRKRAALWSLAILFYFAGHLLESTTIALELYFEHRNYLPALLLFWPLAIWLVAHGETQRARLALSIIIICGLGWMTHSRATVWGDTTQQAVLWAKLNPESPRAQSYVTQILIARGQVTDLPDRLRPLLKQKPNEIQIAFNLIGASCRQGGITAEDIEATRQAILSTPRFGELSFNWLEKTITQAKNRNCRGLTLDVAERLLNAAWNNTAVKRNESWQESILNLRGKLALAKDAPQTAYQHFASAVVMRANPAAALEQAATLGSAGHQKLALCELALWEQQPAPAQTKQGLSMRRLHHRVLEQQNYWANEVAHLKRKLENDLTAEQKEMSCPSFEPTEQSMPKHNAQ